MACSAPKMRDFELLDWILESNAFQFVVSYSCDILRAKWHVEYSTWDYHRATRHLISGLLRVVQYYWGGWEVWDGWLSKPTAWVFHHTWKVLENEMILHAYVGRKEVCRAVPLHLEFYLSLDFSYLKNMSHSLDSFQVYIILFLLCTTAVSSSRTIRSPEELFCEPPPSSVAVN